VSARSIAVLVSCLALVALASTPASGSRPADSHVELIVLGGSNAAGNDAAPAEDDEGASDLLPDLAEQTGGTVLSLPSDSPSEAAEALVDEILGGPWKPSAWAAGPYVTVLDEPVELDGSGSYDRDGRIVSYEWDLDGDGDFEISTPERTYVHTFTKPIDGTIRLRVMDDDGLTAVASARAHASSDGDESPPLVDNCPDVPNHGQSDWDEDGIGDACDPTPFG
jgi:PKD domain